MRGNVAGFLLPGESLDQCPQIHLLLEGYYEQGLNFPPHKYPITVIPWYERASDSGEEGKELCESYEMILLTF